MPNRREFPQDTNEQEKQKAEKYVQNDPFCKRNNNLKTPNS